ncbi:hypothetical protein [Sphingorhabdus sp. M41]|uniref:hypothetical protein n=1 Tax=Sphingorhabdus sp. M41 TaxID=1806885 RepID=UPI00078CA055|nr:hypothetical protein [Sphingorhabdus sp. M41]AMO71553.1 hypothetical protein AZE99_06515 [Sphingorhabdus sp. M41]
MISFNAAQDLVLTALYIREYESDDAFSATIDDVKEAIGGGLSKVFLLRVVDHLVEKNLLESDYDEDIDVMKYWLKANGIQAAEVVVNEQKNEGGVISIPAADRIVQLNDNQFNDLHEKLSEIISTLDNGSNAIGAELGDSRVRLKSEIEAGSTLINAKSVRLSALFAVLIKPLKFLSEKFSGAAIGELAKKLVSEILKLIA